MKRLLAVLLTLIMVFGIVACGADKNTENSDETKEAGEAAAEPEETGE